MQKATKRDKNIRRRYKIKEIKSFVLKAIMKNINFFILIRWNAFLKLKDLSKNSSKVSTVNFCLHSLNKKRLCRLTKFSRHIFLKTARSGVINGLVKATW